MTERDSDRGVDRYGRDPYGPSGWAEEPGASVFDRRERARYPSPGGGGETPYPEDPWWGPPAGGYAPPRTEQVPGQDPYPGDGLHPGQEALRPQGPYGGQVYVPAPTEPVRSAAPPTAPQAWAPEPPAPPAPPPPAGPGRGVPPGGWGRGPGGPGPGRAPRRPPGEDRRGTRGDAGSGGGAGLPVGLGALLGVTGLVCVLLALMVLPWFSARGQDVDLADLRAAFESGEAEAVVRRPSDPAGETGTSLPDDLTSPGEVGEAVRDGVQDAAGDAAADAIASGKTRYMELYTERLWAVVAVGTALAVLFSTILAPRSFVLSLLLGFRRLSGLVTFLAAGAHGVALWILFTGTGAPEPAVGVWVGLAGFAGVLAGCIVGPKR